MFTISEILPIALTVAQIFLSFSLIAALLKIKTYWWATLAYSAIITQLTSPNHWIMLAIFVATAFTFYFSFSKMQLKLTLLAVVFHLFASQFTSNVLLFIFLALTPLVSLTYMRIFSISVYIVLLFIIKYKNFNVVNLIHNKMIFTIAFTIMLLNIALHTLLPITLEQAYYISDIFITLWMAVIQLVIAYMAFALNRFATEIEKHEFHSLYTDTLRESLDHLSMFKHDSRNMIDTLLGFCEMEQYDKIKPYLKELINDIRHDINVGTINAHLKDNMPYLYGIVLAQSAVAATSRIRFNIRITAEKFELKTVSEVQLSRMVGNLLNNAFDAAKMSEKKFVDLEISNVLDNRIKIEVANSVCAAVDTANLLKKGYSTKEGHSGLGLYQIQHIVERQRKEGYNVKFELYNSPNNTFTAELLI